MTHEKKLELRAVLNQSMLIMRPNLKSISDPMGLVLKHEFKLIAVALESLASADEILEYIRFELKEYENDPIKVRFFNSLMGWVLVDVKLKEYFKKEKLSSKKVNSTDRRKSNAITRSALANQNVFFLDSYKK